MDARHLIEVPPAPNDYELELLKLGNTYSAALAIDVSGLKQAIAGASECSLIGVGSGGSFTVASLLCNLHEAYTGRVSRPSTPLEIICNPTLASASPVFLISAEGKNPDIIEALLRARRNSARAVHVITNRKDSPLMHQMAQLSDISSHVFELSDKDGYLATNSLLLDAVVIARAYGELDQPTETLPATIDDLRIDGQTVDQWIQGADGFIEEAVSRQDSSLHTRPCCDRSRQTWSRSFRKPLSCTASSPISARSRMGGISGLQIGHAIVRSWQ
ncbi:MAG: hypothetical protein ACREYF_07980 [Gammaproteobacteria bacterium]